MKCTAYDFGTLWDYKYVVTFALYDGKWILCKHKERETWETSGGHIETGETPAEAAARELREETGALDFDIDPVCDYWACDEPHETKDVSWANGAVFLARVRTVGSIPDNEMAAIRLFDEMPPNLTYPDITKTVFPYALKTIRKAAENLPADMTVNETTLNSAYNSVDNASGLPAEFAADLKFSDIMDMQRQLQKKHIGEWAALTPDYGRNCILWMIEELGEAVSVIKKRGETYIMNDPVIRAAFVEEFVDVLMFMTDAFLCYGINAAELSAAFIKKHTRNMGRD